MKTGYSPALYRFNIAELFILSRTFSASGIVQYQSVASFLLHRDTISKGSYKFFRKRSFGLALS